MTNKILSYVSLGISVVTLVLVIILSFGKTTVLGGTTNYDQLDTTDGYSVDGTSVIDGSGSWIGNVSSSAIVASSLALGGGTAQTKFFCATATWNPGALDGYASSSVSVVTSTDIALAGAVMGDLCQGSLTSATSSVASINCFISGTATGTIRLINLGAAVLDLATGTAKVCYIH